MTSTTPRQRITADQLRPDVVLDRTYATGREEHESCEAGTPGCSINHMADHGSCETW